MSVKNKLMVVPTTVALIATAAVAYTLTRDPAFVLHVSFDPHRGSPAITVQLSDTVPMAYAATVNPWERSISLPPGMRVILSVVQNSAAGRTECSILDADSLTLDHREMWGPGVISCQHVSAG